MNTIISQAQEDRYAQLQMIALDFAREGNTSELKKMLQYGLNINLCTHKSDTLLMLASYKGHLDTVKMLIQRGADVDKTNARGQTPLAGVCFKGNLGMVKLLVEKGANINGAPIVFATIFGNKKIVNYLKEQGVDKKSYKIIGISIDKISSFISFFRNLLSKQIRTAKNF